MAGAKGGGGTPQGQGKGAGGAAQPQAPAGATPPNMQQAQADMLAQQKQMGMNQQYNQFMTKAGANPGGQPYSPGGATAANAGIGSLGGRNPADMQARYAQLQQALANRPAGMNGMKGMDKSQFMPGGALGAANEIAASNPDAALAAAQAASAAPVPGDLAGPQASQMMGTDAMDRMRGQQMSNMQRQPGMGAMPNGMPGGMNSMMQRARQQQPMNGAGGGKAGGGKGGGGNNMRQGASALGALAGRGMMNNGGIVGLANGGRLGGVTGGGVTYGPATPAPPAMAMPVAAAPIAAAPARPAWTPVSAAPAANASLFKGLGSMAAIQQPAKFVAPAVQQAIWQPPAKAVEAAVVKQSPQDIWRNMLNSMRNPPRGGNDRSDHQSYGGRTGGW